MNWISVKDRLPENEQTVLVCVKRMVSYESEEYEIVMLTAIYTDGKHSVDDSDYCDNWTYADYEEDVDTGEEVIIENWWEVPYGLDEMFEIFGNVTHWMPLPDPPEVENE